MKRHHIHPVERADALESPLRYKLQNPEKILGSYIRPGMTVLDFGCGPGFFTTAIARLLNASGKVIAVDAQAGMLEKLSMKIKGSPFEPIIPRAPSPMNKTKEEFEREAAYDQLFNINNLYSNLKSFTPVYSYISFRLKSKDDSAKDVFFSRYIKAEITNDTRFPITFSTNIADNYDL